MAPKDLTHDWSAEDKAVFDVIIANDKAMLAERASERPNRQATKRPATFDSDDSELSELESDDEKVRDGKAALKDLRKAKKPKLIVKLKMIPSTPATRRFSDSCNPLIDEGDSSQPSETPAAQSSQSTNTGLLQTPGTSPDITDTLEEHDTAGNQQLLTPALTNGPPTVSKQKQNSSLPPISITAANSTFRPSSSLSNSTSASGRAVGTPTRVSPRERKASAKSKESELSSAALAQLSDVEEAGDDVKDDDEDDDEDDAEDDAEDGAETDAEESIEDSVTQRTTGRSPLDSPSTSASNQLPPVGRQSKRHSAEVLAPLLAWVELHQGNLVLSKAHTAELAEASGLHPRQVYDWVRKQRVTQEKESTGQEAQPIEQEEELAEQEEKPGQPSAAMPRERDATQAPQPAAKRAKATAARESAVTEPPRRATTAKSKRTPAIAKMPTPRTPIILETALTLRTNQVHDTGDDDVLDPNLSFELVELAQTLHTQSQFDLPNEEKPEPIGKPSVWAPGRQDLCESLPYYRALKGGGYTSGGFAYCFMFDAESHQRDHFDSDVLISRAGGGMGKDEEGNMVASKDQSIDDAQVQSVQNNILQYRPLVLITGNRNTKARFKVPQAYSVLDWFKPAYVWSEKTRPASSKKTTIIVRYRFEKLKPEKESWWTPQGADEPVKVGQLKPPVSKHCDGCDKDWLQVYVQGWMCLQQGCEHFWKLPGGGEPNEHHLRYDPRFLKMKTPWPHSSEPHSLNPGLVQVGTVPNPGEVCNFQAWKGLVCPKCGSCSSREEWEGWRCRSCSFYHSSPRQIISPKMLDDWYHPITANYAASQDASPREGLRSTWIFQNNYRINVIEIPGVDGFAAHFIANKTVNEEPGGPNDMFMELQNDGQKIGLRRQPLGGRDGRSRALTQHFSSNFGMPYKFTGAAGSHSFEDAPQAIKATRARLNWAAQQLPSAAEGHIDFNEVLALGYFENQAINYHDDGEHGLGPTIATLSLGYPARMNLRLKEKHYRGVSKSGEYTDEPSAPGCQHYEARRDAHKELEGLAGAERKAKKKELVDRLQLGKKHADVKDSQRKHAPDAISFKLCHGDIVVMHGEGVQKYYEVSMHSCRHVRDAIADTLHSMRSFLKARSALHLPAAISLLSI